MKQKMICTMFAIALGIMTFSACGSTSDADTATALVTEENNTTDTSSGEVEENITTEATNETESTLIRNTAYGQVQGVQQEDVQVFYGVPYGADTAGENRWQAPKEPDAWTDVKDCTQTAPMTMQVATVYAADGSSSQELTGTTDCLYLDIYTKEDADNLPVFVFLHGGNNQTGSSLDIVGNDMVVTDDCIVVSINHRLGLTGFNCLPALQTEEDSTGNYGLLDIAMALQWVRDNISNFGGDASNVTVSGFSAGGRNVMAMLVSPIFEGLFDKAIAFSGGMTISDEEASAKKIAEFLAPLAVEDGVCADEDEAKEWLLGDGEDVKEYLYSISDERLAQTVGSAGIRMSAFPHLYGDGVVLPESFDNATYVSDVPLIMLTGTSEFSLFCKWDSYMFTLGENQDTAYEFCLKYGSDFYRIFNTQLSAESMDKNYDSDIYVCQINYGGSESASTIDSLGSFHGIFVPMLNSAHTYGSFYDFNVDGYQNMSALFHQYLKNFIYTGNPNSDETDTEWEAWTLEEKNTLVFDADETTKEATAVLEDVYKTNADIIAEMDDDTTLPDDVKAGVIANVMNGRWFSGDLDAYYGNADLWSE